MRHNERYLMSLSLSDWKRTTLLYFTLLYLKFCETLFMCLTWITHLLAMLKVDFGEVFINCKDSMSTRTGWIIWAINEKEGIKPFRPALHAYNF